METNMKNEISINGLARKKYFYIPKKQLSVLPNCIKECLTWDKENYLIH